MSDKSSFRPLISSIVGTQNKFLPLKYSFSLQQICQIKKYLPKTFKLQGVDSKKPYTKQQSEIIVKNKLKIKAVNEQSQKNQVQGENKSIGKNQSIDFYQKNKIGALEWYKTISITIPYNSKNQQQQTNAKFTQIFAYYLQHLVHFQNNLKGDLIELQQKSQKTATLQQMKDIDLLVMAWEWPAEANDDKIKLITLNLPIVILLEEGVRFNLLDLRQIVISQCTNSFQTLLKHNFNTKVLVNGKQEKRFIWLNSYCNEEKALDEQNKLMRIIGQQKKQQAMINPQQSRKQYKFLVMVLIALVCFYLALKIYPINPKQPIVTSYTYPKQSQHHSPTQEQQIF